MWQCTKMDKYEVCTVDMVYTADRVVTVDAVTIQTALPPLDYYDYWSTCGADKWYTKEDTAKRMRDMKAYLKK